MILSMKLRRCFSFEDLADGCKQSILLSIEQCQSVFFSLLLQSKPSAETPICQVERNLIEIPCETRTAKKPLGAKMEDVVMLVAITKSFVWSYAGGLRIQ